MKYFGIDCPLLVYHLGFETNCLVTRVREEIASKFASLLLCLPLSRSLIRSGVSNDSDSGVGNVAPAFDLPPLIRPDISQLSCNVHSVTDQMVRLVFICRPKWSPSKDIGYYHHAHKYSEMLFCGHPLCSTLSVMLVYSFLRPFPYKMYF